MVRTRFAPSPTGSLHVGNALSAVANRRFGDWLLAWSFTVVGVAVIAGSLAARPRVRVAGETDRGRRPSLDTSAAGVQTA